MRIMIITVAKGFKKNIPTFWHYIFVSIPEHAMVMMRRIVNKGQIYSIFIPKVNRSLKFSIFPKIFKYHKYF